LKKVEELGAFDAWASRECDFESRQASPSGRQKTLWAAAVNNAEAEGIIDTELAKYRDWTYEQLSAMAEAPKQTFEVIGASGTTYYVDVYARWDGEVGGPIRLWVTTDDGGWRAFLPMSKTFIKAADGRFVGETSN
jgi:hypothetical protein